MTWWHSSTAGSSAMRAEEARLDARVAPADEDEGEQLQPQRLRRDVGMDAGDDAALDQLPRPAR